MGLVDIESGTEKQHKPGPGFPFWPVYPRPADWLLAGSLRVKAGLPSYSVLSIEPRALSPKEVCALLKSQALLQGDWGNHSPVHSVLLPIIKATSSTGEGIWKEEEGRKSPLILTHFALSLLR